MWAPPGRRGGGLGWRGTLLELEGEEGVSRELDGWSDFGVVDCSMYVSLPRLGFVLVYLILAVSVR